jgi:hypothetical protein
VREKPCQAKEGGHCLKTAGRAREEGGGQENAAAIGEGKGEEDDPRAASQI